MGIILHVYSFTNMKTTNFIGLLMFSFFTAVYNGNIYAADL